MAGVGLVGQPRVTLLGRYIVGHYLKVFALCMAAATSAFLVVDAIDRIASYSEYAPEARAMAAFYLFRLPRILSDIYPAVALLTVLLSLGLLARHREILAMRTCGISSWQIAMPLIAASTAISLAMFVWDETVVPPSASHARHIKDVVIKKRDIGLLSARSIWFQDRQGFMNVEYFDANRSTLYGLTLYDASAQFDLRRIVEVPAASWENGAWRIPAGSVKHVDSRGRIEQRPLAPGDLVLTDSPSDFAKKRPQVEEYTYAALADRIETLEAKGVDAVELRVDLHAKLAIPFAGIVTVLVGFPLAVRGGRRFGLAYNVGVGLAMGFAFWATMAVALSAGRTGSLPPVVAAWTANAVFALLGVILQRTADV